MRHKPCFLLDLKIDLALNYTLESEKYKQACEDSSLHIFKFRLYNSNFYFFLGLRGVIWNRHFSII
jgi:hypothetical protein